MNINLENWYLNYIKKPKNENLNQWKKENIELYRLWNHSILFKEIGIC